MVNCVKMVNVCKKLITVQNILNTENTFIRIQTVIILLINVVDHCCFDFLIIFIVLKYFTV